MLLTVIFVHAACVCEGVLEGVAEGVWDGVALGVSDGVWDGVLEGVVVSGDAPPAERPPATG